MPSTKCILGSSMSSSASIWYHLPYLHCTPRTHRRVAPSQSSSGWYSVIAPAPVPSLIRSMHWIARKSSSTKSGMKVGASIPIPDRQQRQSECMRMWCAFRIGAMISRHRTRAP
eukprot:scaffold200511_cov29-Tisochrysis_lutea.AAC.2